MSEAQIQLVKALFVGGTRDGEWHDVERHAVMVEDRGYTYRSLHLGAPIVIFIFRLENMTVYDVMSRLTQNYKP